jgi:tetratricopeptide (TPR) repeat protein
VSKVAQEAQALLEEGDLKGAMRVVNGGLNKDPEDMAALMLASCIVSRESCWGMSYNLLKRVADNSPAFPEIYNNLAMAASSLASSSGKDKYLDEAEACLRKAYKKSQAPEITANLALIMLHKLQLDAAERFCNESLAKDPGNASARETLGYVNLHRGKWVEGFGNYEFTLGGKYRKHPKGKYWEKGDRGKKLLVIGEQGIGDEISYASALPDAAKDNRITYECDHRLVGLMKRSLPDVEVYGTRFVEDKPFDREAFDIHALTGSLCMQYRQKDEDFPRKGFLVADPERRLQWRALLDTLPGKKVGIAWTGGLENTFKHRRSFSLEGLQPILQIPGITWVSMQYAAPEGLEKHGIKHWARAVEKGCDYDETAALVSELDCVVTVTTAIAHLCGALGKKAYVLVPNKNRWFYSSDSSKHRWYESLELFRQQDKWPVEKLAQRLKDDLCK